MGADELERRIPGWCALCRSRCGCINVVRDGRLVAVEPDPRHPTGRALCAKGRAAPELVHHPERLMRPLMRSRPKGDADPGWREIPWDEALDRTAAALKRFADESGPESVVFAPTTPSGTAISDAIHWIERLIRAYGSPNNLFGTEICNWHKDVAHRYTFGAAVGTPDFGRVGCLVLWGHNPSAAWLAQAERAAEARRRGAKLVVVDPRRVGLAAKADQWLRVRPGSDGALALAIAGVMIEAGWYDEAFVRDWTNAAFLVRDDEDRLLTECDLIEGGRPDAYVAWDEEAARPVAFDCAAGAYDGPIGRTRLRGTIEVPAAKSIACRPVFERFAALCGSLTPERAAAITWVPAERIRATARLLWEARPVAYHAWSGVGQHTNATQTERAIACLYALTGSFDAPGGNAYFARVPVNDVAGAELMTEAQAAKALGLKERPLGPAKDWWVTTDDFVRAVLTGEPYRVRGLVAFGTNLLVSRGGVAGVREALGALEFTVHTDLFMNPSAAYADIVLPVTSPWEHESLKVGFEMDQEAMGLVQLRPAAVAARGEARSDTAIVFDLAVRLGLGNEFWGGELEAAWRHQLGPSGLRLDELRAAPDGVRVPLRTEYRKYRNGRGFETPSSRVEIWSETFRSHGYPPLPAFVEPATGPASAPELATRYPLVLTSAKSGLYCHSQHRNLASLRRRSPDPEVEIHPETAASRGIAAGDWVEIASPAGTMRARARLNGSLDPRVVAAAHGWWQACTELGLQGYPVDGEGAANVNALIPAGTADPISGSVPHRSFLCEVRKPGRGA